MVSSAYQLGLLLVVFGGFLASNSSGTPAEWGIWAMVFGFLVGLLGIVHPSATTRSDTPARSAANEE